MNARIEDHDAWAARGRWKDAYESLLATRRADLPPTDAQIMAHPSVAALVKALEKIRDGDALPTPSTGGMPPGQYAFIRRAGPWAQIAIAALAAMPGVRE